MREKFSCRVCEAITQPPAASRFYDTDDRQTVAFTPAGIEALQEMLAEYKRSQSSARS